jgi:hypothetical protein
MKIFMDSRYTLKNDTNFFITFVIAGRNDDYGGNFVGRLLHFLRTVICSCLVCGIQAEIVLVEWNPSPDRQLLRDLLHSVRTTKSAPVRIITVPPEIHMRLPNSNKMTFFEYIAKNIGIRKARGKFILCTNPDVVFSPEMFTWLGSGQIDEGEFYRIDRIDFHPTDQTDVSSRDYIRLAKRSAFRIARRHNRMNDEPFAIFANKGIYEANYFSEPLAGEKAHPYLPQFEASSQATETFGLHVNASGDFLLASGDAWRAIGGYPESTDSFTHLDGCGVARMRWLGLRQIILLPPIMMLHANHSRTDQADRPSWSWSVALAILEATVQGNWRPAPGWGLLSWDERLSECVI